MWLSRCLVEVEDISGMNECLSDMAERLVWEMCNLPNKSFKVLRLPIQQRLGKQRIELRVPFAGQLVNFGVRWQPRAVYFAAPAGIGCNDLGSPTQAPSSRRVEEPKPLRR